MTDSDLMELVQLYKARWLSCVTQEEAQRLRDEIERLRAPTRDVTPASGEIANEILRRLTLLMRTSEYPTSKTAADAIAEIERLSKFEPSPAEQAQRKRNNDAWERNKDIRLGTDRGQG